MLKLFFAFSLGSIAFSSCGHSKQNSETIIAARNYYDSVNYQYKQNRELQQSLVDKISEFILNIKGKTSTIDTKELKMLADSAKSKNITAIKNIGKITEIDKHLNYKQVVMEYLVLFNTFYDNELKDLIKLIDDKDEEAFTKASKFILPKMKLIKDKEIEYTNAKETFKAKYPVSPDGTIHTNPDYELVNFSDFDYEEANLNEGEEISLISYSGGKDCDLETKYYEQFIGISKSTGDTVRILVPCQFYDINNPERICYYRKEIPDSTQNTFSGKSLIVFNKHLANLEKKDFKTTVGMLVFSKE